MGSSRRIELQQDKVYLVLDMNVDWRKVIAELPAQHCSVVQLRDKEASDQQMLRWGRELQRRLPKEVCLIVNDRVDVAKELGVGVHLGMDDQDPIAARSILGDQVPIGLTIHDRVDLAEKYRQYVNYVGVGPIFPTRTKPDARSVLGVSSLAEISRRVSLPTVAIGGINAENALSVWEAGADQIAVCSAVMRAIDPRAALLSLRKRSHNI